MKSFKKSYSHLKIVFPFKFLSQKKGLAMLEAFIILWMMFILLGATLGSWGIAHTAILNSISARNWTFFLLNNRSDLSYARDFGANEYSSSVFSDDLASKYYRKDGGGPGRIFAYITSEEATSEDEVIATGRKVDFNKTNYAGESNPLGQSAHNIIFNTLGNPRDDKKTLPLAWIMVGYGICLNSDCD